MEPAVGTLSFVALARQQQQLLGTLMLVLQKKDAFSWKIT
jgi:hypothetical protein